MTTLSAEGKTAFVTLKAEKVNEFEFVKETSKYTINSNKHTYTDDRKALVSVKIGNTIVNTHIRLVREWVNEEKVYTPTVYTRDFDTLINAGIEIDFSSIIAHYKAELENVEFIIKEMIADYEADLLAKKIERYKNSWIHTFASQLAADKNRKIKALLPLVTFAKIEQAPFLRGIELLVTVSYKGIDINITHNGDAYVFGSGYTGVEPNRIWVQLTPKGKNVKAKGAGTIFLKLIEAIDDRERNINYKHTQAEKEKFERDVRKEVLELASGEKVTIMVEEKYETSYSYRGSRNDYSKPYKVYSYQITLGERKVYINYSDREGIKTYSFGALSGLTEIQLKGLIQVLKA